MREQDEGGGKGSQLGHVFDLDIGPLARPCRVFGVDLAQELVEPEKR